MKEELLRRMKRKKDKLDVYEKLKVLHNSMKAYDQRMAELRPFFMDDSERNFTERRLSKLQWGIDDEREAKEMKGKWAEERIRKFQRSQRNGISVSLSPGLRVLLRPHGLGNFQISSRHRVGSPFNPNEVSMNMINDGNIPDTNNGKPRPPFVSVQPTLNVIMNTE